VLVMQHIAVTEGIFFGLAFMGLLLCGRQRLPSGLLLFGSALLVPLYHTYKGELVSLDKHLAFSMFFLAPLAGFAIASLVGLWQKRSVRLSWFTGLALCLLTFPLGLQQARNLYEVWPSSSQLTTFLRSRVQPGIGHYLAEDSDVLRYNLKNETDIWQWNSLDYFVYTDNEKHDLSGDAAYKAAIQEGYFDVIELSYGYHAPLAMQITQNLTASKHYDLIARIPLHNSYGDGYFWVWSKHVTSSTSCTQPEAEPGKISLAGLAYSPSHIGQDPTQGGGFPSSEEIEADMLTLAPLTRYIRTYSATGPASEIVRAAERARVCVALGIDLSKNTAANAREMTGAEGLASNNAVRSIIVGNEVLQRGDLSEAQLRSDIEQVRAKLGRAVPITTAETYMQWMKHPELAQAVDFITVHIYPFWQRIPIDAAIPFLDQVYTQLQKTFPDKQIVIGETGWPSAGPAYGAAVPSAANQARYLREFVNWAQAKGMQYFYFDAFDEGWKVDEAGVGTHWGLYQQDGEVKPALRAMLQGPAPATVVQRSYRDVYVGGLVSGFGLGVETSGRQRQWLTASNEMVVLRYPPKQQWGQMFISVGPPAPPGHRSSLDLSAYRSLVVDMRAAVDGQCIRIGIKDKNQPDDGSEFTVQRCLTTQWSTITLPLSAFTGVDLKQLYVVFEVLFQGSSSTTVEIRNVRYSPT
jgi:exo-beta-1,3-glucanase (GH17 family)